jgi:hypothetical protein
MQQVLTQRPIGTTLELAEFEKEMSILTSGFSLRRSMSYNQFRMSVLQCHQTGCFCELKCILMHNHFIFADDGVATLYRNIDEAAVVECNDVKLDEACGNEHAKRAKHCNELQ